MRLIRNRCTASELGVGAEEDEAASGAGGERPSVDGPGGGVTQVSNEVERAGRAGTPLRVGLGGNGFDRK
jgi:hypothetical protein